MTALEFNGDWSVLRKKLADCTPDELMLRIKSQGSTNLDWLLGLQTVKNARAQIRRVTGMDNDQVAAWFDSGLTHEAFTHDAGVVAPEKEATMASKTKTDDLAQFMTGKGKGGTVTQHGVTTTGYQRGCRCELCTAAMSTYIKARREARKVEAAEAAADKDEKNARARARRASKKAAAV